MATRPHLSGMDYIVSHVLPRMTKEKGRCPTRCWERRKCNNSISSQNLERSVGPTCLRLFDLHESCAGPNSEIHTPYYSSRANLTSSTHQLYMVNDGITARTCQTQSRSVLSPRMMKVDDGRLLGSFEQKVRVPEYVVRQLRTAPAWYVNFEGL